MTCPTPNKYAHASEAGARIHMAQMIQKGQAGLHVYRCACKSWHVGRRKKWKLPRLRPQRSAANRRRR